jgi:hypothetical protein
MGPSHTHVRGLSGLYCGGYVRGTCGEFQCQEGSRWEGLTASPPPGHSMCGMIVKPDPCTRWPGRSTCQHCHEITNQVQFCNLCPHKTEVNTRMDGACSPSDWSTMLLEQRQQPCCARRQTERATVLLAPSHHTTTHTFIQPPNSSQPLSLPHINQSTNQLTLRTCTRTLTPTSIHIKGHDTADTVG